MKKGEMLSYTKGSKVLHWLIAVVVILMLAVSFFLDDLPKAYAPLAFTVHKSFGLSILALVLLRLFWLHYAGRPTLPKSVPAWERFLAKLVQYGLYVCLLLQPICGWIMSMAANRVPRFFGMFPLPLPGIPEDKNLAHFMANCHTVIAYVLISLIIVHIAAALKHHYIDKDGVLRSMLPKRS